MAERGMGRIFKPIYKSRRGKWRHSTVWWISYYHNGREEREFSGSR
jgi:hypothetical protein